jgi:FixJ family two-component response regulator
MTLRPTIFVVDDDEAVRDSLCALLDNAGFCVETYGSADEFLREFNPERIGCVLLDVMMPDMTGIELQAELGRRGARLPVVFLTGNGNIPMSVHAMRAGAADFLTKPVEGRLVIERIGSALNSSVNTQRCVGSLSARERQVLARVVAGQSSKQIARELGISHRTVEIHRAHVMHKTRARSVVDLAQIAQLLGPST